MMTRISDYCPAIRWLGELVHLVDHIRSKQGDSYKTCGSSIEVHNSFFLFFRRASFIVDPDPEHSLHLWSFSTFALSSIRFPVLSKVPPTTANSITKT